MNVTTTESGDLKAILRVEIQPEDYKEKVEKTLQDYRRKANIPGFRPGKVPASLIRKQYGKSVLIDEVNHLLQHAVYDHLREEELDILGNPLPVPNDQIDWDNQDSFEFDFELGLTPQFELKLNEKLKVPYYKIVADKEMLDRYANDYARRFGSMKYPEKVTDDAIIKGIFQEVDKSGSPVVDGINNESTFSMESVDDKKLRKELLGKVIGDKLILDISKAFKKEFNTSNLLGTDDEGLKNSTGIFELDIIELSELIPAELNQELFDKVYGEGTVNGKDEFFDRIRQDAEGMFVGESDRKFLEDIKEKVLSKTKFDLPDEFLKKWLRTNQENPVSEEQIEQEYPELKDNMKWQLVENKVMKDNSIEIGQEEIIEYTKGLIANQMRQYGQEPDPSSLDGIAANVLQNQEEAQRITDQLASQKLLEHYKKTVKLDTKEVTFDDFLKKVTK
jgi:trigger factor